MAKKAKKVTKKRTKIKKSKNPSPRKKVTKPSIGKMIEDFIKRIEAI